MLSETNGWNSFLYCRRLIKQLHFTWPGAVCLAIHRYCNTVFQLLYCFSGDRTLNLYLVFTLMHERRIEQTMIKLFIICEIIEYIPNAVTSKTIIKKATGVINISSFDSGESLTEGISRFDTFIQVIDGSVNITAADQRYEKEVHGDPLLHGITLRDFGQSAPCRTGAPSAV